MIRFEAASSGRPILAFASFFLGFLTPLSVHDSTDRIKTR